jgi:phosphoglycerate kinase
MAISLLQNIKTVRDFKVAGKNVFLRLDLNVPMLNGKILDENRITEALPTIKYLLKEGAKLVVASHLGRPEKSENPKEFSMEPIAHRLSELLETDVSLVEDPRAETPAALLTGLKAGQLIVLENLRFDPSETKNGFEMSQAIAKYTDIYINDAFGASHRAHASMHSLPSLIDKKGIGFLIEKEIKFLEKIKNNPDRPFTVILGGAKVSDKVPLIEKLMDHVDQIIIGGAMAYTFLAAKGVAVGSSRVEKDQVNFAKNLIRRMENARKPMLLPVDHVVSDSITNEAGAKTLTGGIPVGMMGLDIGPKTTELYIAAVKSAKTVFWNGPMGVFESKAFSKGTFLLAQGLSEISGTVVVGGGDSASAAKAAGVADKMAHISTGGGASLEFLQGEKLPGIEILRPPKRSETGELEDLS